MNDKKKDKNFSLSPPTPQSMEEFISQADDKVTPLSAKQVRAAAKPTPTTPKASPEAKKRGRPKISESDLKSLRLGIHEEYLDKLRDISKKSRISQQELARSFLYPAIEDALKQLEEKGFLTLANED